MKWFHRTSLGCSGRPDANVDAGNESVADEQLSSTCVAAVVGSGSARFLLADGSNFTVPEALIERSAVLSELVGAAELTSPVIVAARGHMYRWIQYLQLTSDARDSSNWLHALRSLMAADFMADDATVRDLCRRLGAVVSHSLAGCTGEAQHSNSSASKFLRSQKQKQLLPSCSVLLRELPDHLAVCVLRSSGVTLHQCMLALPPQQHACAVEALCVNVSSDKVLHIAGRDTAKVHYCINDSCDVGDETQCLPVDTVAVACSAAASFTYMQKLHLSSMHVHSARSTSISLFLSSLPGLQDLRISSTDLSAAAMDTLSAGLARCTALTAFQMSDCRVLAPVATAPDVLTVTSLPCTSSTSTSTATATSKIARTSTSSWLSSAVSRLIPAMHAETGVSSQTQSAQSSQHSRRSTASSGDASTVSSGTLWTRGHAAKRPSWLRRNTCMSGSLSRTLSSSAGDSCSGGGSVPTLSAGSSVVVDATAENPHSTPGALGGPGDDGASHNLPEASSIKVSGYDSPSQSVESRRHLWRVSASSPASPAVASAGALVHALACLPRLARLELTEVTFEGPDSPILQLLYSLSRLQSLKHLILSKVGLSHKGITGLAGSLAVMTHLEEVVLLGYRISGWPVQVLAAALAQLHDIVRLELELASVNTCWSTSSMHASARPCLELSAALASLPRLRHLHLRGYLGTEGLDTLCSALPSLHNLEHIILCESRYCFTYPNGLTLCRELASKTKLASVTFTNVDLQSDGSVSLAATLGALPGLKKLVLGFSRLMETTLWVPAVMPAIQGLSGLEHLGMSTCVDESGTAESLAVSLSNLQSLQRLRFHVAFSRDSLAQVVLSALSHLTKLSDLRLCTIGIDTGGAQTLCTALLMLQNLELLSLRRDGVPPSNVIYIAPALVKLQTLKHLELIFSNTFRDRDYRFAEALASLTQLTHLTTSGVQLQLCGMHVLTPATSNFQLTNLEVLGLKNVPGFGVRGNGGSGGICGVAEFIRKLPKLRILNLSCSQVGDSGIAILAHSLKGRYSLREVDVSKTGISDVGAALLMAALESIYVRKVLMHGNRGIVNKQADIFKRSGVHLEEV